MLLIEWRSLDGQGAVEVARWSGWRSLDGQEEVEVARWSLDGQGGGR